MARKYTELDSMVAKTQWHNDFVICEVAVIKSDQSMEIHNGVLSL